VARAGERTRDLFSLSVYFLVTLPTAEPRGRVCFTKQDFEIFRRARNTQKGLFNYIYKLLTYMHDPCMEECRSYAPGQKELGMFNSKQM
jgi:hypothetical protein